MSKLFKEYEKLKQKNPDILYLFKSGIFYIGLNEDASKLANLFQFKITNLNDTVTKCGFPTKKLEFYTNLLNRCSVKFEIIDPNALKTSPIDYLNYTKTKEILQSIANLDMNSISFEESFQILQDFNKTLKSLNFPES